MRFAFPIFLGGTLGEKGRRRRDWMANSGIDIRRERGSGPEVRRTTGGMLYRVSRTNTPDLMEIRRELDRQREREDASARKSEAANTVESSSANTQYRQLLLCLLLSICFFWPRVHTGAQDCLQPLCCVRTSTL